LVRTIERASYQVLLSTFAVNQWVYAPSYVLQYFQDKHISIKQEEIDDVIIKANIDVNSNNKLVAESLHFVMHILENRKVEWAMYRKIHYVLYNIFVCTLVQCRNKEVLTKDVLNMTFQIRQLFQDCDVLRQDNQETLEMIGYTEEEVKKFVRDFHNSNDEDKHYYLCIRSEEKAVRMIRLTIQNDNVLTKAENIEIRSLMGYA
jgi:hypothetical protein